MKGKKIPHALFLVIVEFFHIIEEEKDYVLLTLDNDGEMVDRFGKVSPEYRDKLIFMGVEKEALLYFHNPFLSRAEFKNFAKTHNVLNKQPINWDTIGEGEQGKAPMST